MRGFAFPLAFLLVSPASMAVERGYSGSIQVAYGQHFTGKIIAPTYFPALEFRFGYAVSGDFTMRLDLGAGLTEIAESDRASFEGATFMVGNASMAFLYTPAVSEGFHVNLGAGLGLWFSAMWGDDLLGTVSGSVQKYLEALSISYAAVAGTEWDLSDRCALFFEVRGNLALAKFGQEYNTGGVTVLVGFLYRVRSSGP